MTRLDRIPTLHPDLMAMNCALTVGGLDRHDISGLLHRLADKAAPGRHSPDWVRVMACLPHSDSAMNDLLNALAKAGPVYDCPPWDADDLDEVAGEIEYAAAAYVEQIRALAENLRDPHSR